MSVWNIFLLVLYALGMSVGQVFFKLSADQIKANADTRLLLALTGSGYFYLAIILYGVMTILWVWILTRVPLSRAYPFVVLAFAFTPVLAVLFFRERLDLWYFVAMGFILIGLGLIICRAT